ncbi:hypothetical protein Vadar_020947 [Vaccinium darrowii]|uniref:Uncharacterized protein n=1 Tax=Vaccinium darrowii TaxID=229202 RepID=A0ACB7YH23_9ERIC|nr:hypothetical protein Vadar_020947 [Vaccinium darrowii]
MYAYPDAYEVLKEFGYPVGLLPKEVAGYKLDRCTGEFSVYLATKRCNFSTGSYSLIFKQTITGVLNKERISRIRGVKVKGLFGWTNLDEVLQIREGFVEISNDGVSGSTIPIEDLLVSPHCGCGFQCKNAPLSSPQCGFGIQPKNIPSSSGSVAIKVENKLAESNFSTHSTDPVSPPSGFPSQETPELDVNFSKLAAQLEDISDILEEINDRRPNITLLYDEVMKVRDFNESMLLSRNSEDVYDCVDDQCDRVACQSAVDFVVEVLYASFVFEIPELVALS